MLLLVREGCQFCEGLPEREDLRIFTVVERDSDFKVKVGESLIDMPVQVTGLPALLVDNLLIQGKTEIFLKLREMGVVA